MKSFSLHSLLFFIPDEISDTTIYTIIIGILCIILAFSLICLYRRIKHGSAVSFLEGMTPSNTALYPDVVQLQSQADALKQNYDKLTNTINDQKNHINANSQTLMKTLNDVPNQTNSLTHANLNQDDVSKTPVPNIDMS